MIRPNPNGDRPRVHPGAFVDPTAILCGSVIVQENVFIGPYAVIRADEMNDTGGMEPIVIGAHSNIQDGVVIHSKSGAAVTIGERTSIAHRAIVHGPCRVGDGVFIGFNSVLFNCVIGAATDLEALARVSVQDSAFSEDVARTNNSLVEGYKRIQNEF